MTTIRNTAIATVAAITMAVSMSSSANAGGLTTGEKVAIGFGAFGLAAAIASGNAYYDDGYRGSRHYRRTARHCARLFGWETWRWDRCMRRRGY